MKHKSVLFITQAAAIAALYATLTILQNILLPGSASMAIQFRVSEVLTILAIYTPAAIPGLTLGCVVANISSIQALGFYDLVFGSLASLIAACAMYALRNERICKIPFFSLLMPALANGVIVGFEIDFFFVNQFSFNLVDFLIQGSLVALGELAVLMILGLPLSILFEKQNLAKKLKLTE